MKSSEWNEATSQTLAQSFPWILNILLTNDFISHSSSPVPANLQTMKRNETIYYSIIKSKHQYFVQYHVKLRYCFTKAEKFVFHEV